MKLVYFQIVFVLFVVTVGLFCTEYYMFPSKTGRERTFTGPYFFGPVRAGRYGMGPHPPRTRRDEIRPGILWNICAPWSWYFYREICDKNENLNEARLTFSPYLAVFFSVFFRFIWGFLLFCCCVFQESDARKARKKLRRACNYCTEKKVSVFVCLFV